MPKGRSHTLVVAVLMLAVLAAFLPESAGAQTPPREGVSGTDSPRASSIEALLDTTGAIVQGTVSLPRTRVTDDGTTLYADYEIHYPVVVFPRDTRGLGLEVSRPTWTQTIVVRVGQVQGTSTRGPLKPGSRRSRTSTQARSVQSSLSTLPGSSPTACVRSGDNYVNPADGPAKR